MALTGRGKELECEIGKNYWEGDCWGSFLGLGKMRLYINDKDYKTFWHIFIWKFSIGISLPSMEN